MTRKAFNEDVEAARGKNIPDVLAVGKGEDDGDVTFTFNLSPTSSVEIGLLALDVSGYPLENTFMIFTKDSEVPDIINSALEAAASSSTGMTIPEVITSVVHRLQRVLTRRRLSDDILRTDGPYETEEDDSHGVDEDEVGQGDGNGGEDEDEDQDDDEEQYDYQGFTSDEDNFGDANPSNSHKSTFPVFNTSLEATAKINKRIRADLRTTKFAGFRLGILSGLNAKSQSSILSTSIRVSRLGLSEQVLQAWDLEPHQYIVLLTRYGSGYNAFEAVISKPIQALDISFRIGVSNRYKPTLDDARAAFADVAKGTAKATRDLSDGDSNSLPSAGQAGASFSSLFISSSLNEFLNEQFISLLKIREGMGLGWDGAKLFLTNMQGRLNEQNSPLDSKYYDESVPAQSLSPDIMHADHLTDKPSTGTSFPLIAAQFAMRYLFRCTEFCLVCHDPTPGAFDALKPYVCDKPLCLYQYMSLGFGPSLEHEIVTQPFVVDLLISFCYTAALYRKIMEYPIGMGLLVPPQSTPSYPPDFASSTAPAGIPSLADSFPPPGVGVDIKYNPANLQFVFLDVPPRCPIRNDDWIVVTETNLRTTHHRVVEISSYPIIDISPGYSGNKSHVPTNGSANPTGAATVSSIGAVPARMAVYDQNFDDLDDDKKSMTIVNLLTSLPSVRELQAYLIQQGRFSEPSLRAWKERISPAALGLVRWIIASNRSCIVQVDKCPGQNNTDLATAKVRLDQKCSNVEDCWLQFRFMQGAPDKEQRFWNALKEEQSNLDPRYPTMFAFHGSPIENWHNIIRTGLNFEKVAHGRAFGHGVYHATQQYVSINYTGGNKASWPNSDLKISAAMSLNEIVNLPGRFVTSDPYQVVQFVDWIQCRYLLVRIDRGPRSPTEAGKPSSVVSSAPQNIEQDPKYTPMTTLHKVIEIPQCAVSTSRSLRSHTAPAGENTTPKKKKRKNTKAGGSPTQLETISDDDDIEDMAFLFTDDEVPQTEDKGIAERLAIRTPTTSQTDFRPGTLDQSKLLMLSPPLYATTSATMRLNKELKDILKVQAATPLHELGWYIDGELISNVYQWIVELHSFEETLPLAKDMKAAGLTSIVLEIRFGKDYPHSPPFVRVIRPRFLPFFNGGGGHVTGGGAMCMELLTNTGWSAVSSIESVLLQVRLAMMNLEPKPARLESKAANQQSDYSPQEAMQAYIRACQTHGWEIPKDFGDFALPN